HYAGTGLAHAYASEDLTDVQRILGRQYHAVVGNPPYIVVKDAALSAAYRGRYTSCHMKYSLGAPFTERFFELALTGPAGGDNQQAGFVGLITTNSFMKREFGSKLIEQVLPRLDLSHVVDTSGAYIPGHGTPTVILFGRHRPPVGSVVRTVMGIKGEPDTPADPARGLVWSAILGQLDLVDSESDFISVADSARNAFSKHPWSIGGGGAADLKEQIEGTRSTLNGIAESIGFASFTGTDEVFAAPASTFTRKGFPDKYVRSFVQGDAVRDYQLGSDEFAFAPYHADLSAIPLEPNSSWGRSMWLYRACLEGVISFAGKTRKDCGDQWWTWYRWVPSKYRAPLTITFGEITTHNHFVLDRGGKVFKQTAPVIKLPAGASENDHLGLLGLLNSSVGCFWLKQVCHNKGGGGSTTKLAAEQWENFFAINTTKVSEFPLCKGRPLASASQMDALAQQLRGLQPATLLAFRQAPTRLSLDAAHARATQVRQHMIGEQEELDWHCYRLYELLPADVSVEDVEHSTPVEVELGERAFEIVLARRVAAGTETTNWFERHGSAPITEIPARWPETYRRVVQRRIELIESDPTLRLLEQPLCKRRWNSPKWADLEKAALGDWLLARLEAKALWFASTDQPPEINTTSRLADTVQRDAEFMQIAALYAGHADFDLAQLVAGLVTAESVPFLPALRYSDTGLRKRAQWENTWALQRREDQGENIGTTPVPPKYKKEDFLKVTFWDLRGGLDVPKERWVSYPGCERGADTSLPIAWAGWDHLQQATALAAYYLEMKESEGWEAARLQPLLAGLLELVPWLEQWHNEVDPVYGERMGAYYKGFVTEEARAHGFTLDDLRAWKSAAITVKRGRKAKT
ncbi:MAG: BREX-2 system adenine-specific DNA-methyltransferase PglX, partial [Betaproteobacteria bacterium]